MIAVHAPFNTSPRAAGHDTLNLVRLRTAAIAETVLDRLRQTLCGMHGHEMMLQFESTRLSLHCMSCGRTTPGWAIGQS